MKTQCSRPIWINMKRFEKIWFKLEKVTWYHILSEIKILNVGSALWALLDKLQLPMLARHIGMPLTLPAALLPTQLPTNWLWRQQSTGQVLGPLLPCRDQDGTLRFCLRPGPDLAVAIILGGENSKKISLLSFSFFLFFSQTYPFSVMMPFK